MVIVNNNENDLRDMLKRSPDEFWEATRDIYVRDLKNCETKIEFHKIINAIVNAHVKVNSMILMELWEKKENETNALKNKFGGKNGRTNNSK